MSPDSKKELERIFRTSGSSNELFDAFHIAISNKIDDPEFYRALLWNKALSPDEVSMFAEKICKDFPNLSYKIYYWVGKIFGATSIYGEHFPKAVNYLSKASHLNPKSETPLLTLIDIYNKDLNIPPLDEIINLFEERIDFLEKKSLVCFSLANLFEQIGRTGESKKYRDMGEKFLRKGL